MSLSIRKLNADTTFLFTFEREGSSSIRVLVDPWLAGDSSWLHPSFQFSSHTTPPAVTSLADLQDDIDVILISQDKPDHCHKETLCSWPRSRKVCILATPAAAKKIREWKHFDHGAVEDLAPYSAGDSSTLKVIYDEHGSSELTVANMISRKDLTGLHNAIGFTFGPSIPRQDLSLTALQTPPESPTLLRPQELPTLRARIKSYSSLRSVARRPRTPIATPPHTPDGHSLVSCIYTPHGVAGSLLEPYVQYLAAMRALPLTLLVHSMVQECNPWFMGGIVAAGAPGGMEVVKMLGGKVKTWLAAHDEEKDNRGVSVRLLKTHRYGEDDVHDLLEQEGFGHVRVACIESGASLSLAG